MNQKPISDPNGLAKRPDWLATFAGTPRLCELSGPGTLIRLVQFEKSTYDGLQMGNSPREGAFSFAEQFLDEAKLPDAQKAREHWAKVKPQLSRLTRVCRRFDLSQSATPEVIEQLDMESRWEACLHGMYEGTWKGSPFDLERFPQASLRGGG